MEVAIPRSFYFSFGTSLLILKSEGERNGWPKGGGHLCIPQKVIRRMQMIISASPKGRTARMEVAMRHWDLHRPSYIKQKEKGMATSILTSSGADQGTLKCDDKSTNHAQNAPLPWLCHGTAHVWAHLDPSLCGSNVLKTVHLSTCDMWADRL